MFTDTNAACQVICAGVLLPEAWAIWGQIMSTSPSLLVHKEFTIMKKKAKANR
jgi:hypothetical protein